MASIKELKKDINYLTYELLIECYTYKHFHPDKKESSIDEVIKSIIQKRSELIYKINHLKDVKEDKKSIHNHFKTIITDCNENYVSLVDKLKDLE